LRGNPIKSIISNNQTHPINFRKFHMKLLQSLDYTYTASAIFNNLLSSIDLNIFSLIIKIKSSRRFLFKLSYKNSDLFIVHSIVLV